MEYFKLFRLVFVPLSSNILAIVWYGVSQNRGGDLGAALGHFWSDLIVLGLIWLVSIIAAINFIPSKIDGVKQKYFEIIRIAAIIFCTPIPFMVGCVAFH